MTVSSVIKAGADETEDKEPILFIKNRNKTRIGSQETQGTGTPTIHIYTMTDTVHGKHKGYTVYIRG